MPFVPGTLSATLLYWDRKQGPDPNQYSASYHVGAVLPWVTVVHDWNEAAGRSGWRYTVAVPKPPHCC